MASEDCGPDLTGVYRRPHRRGLSQTHFRSELAQTKVFSAVTARVADRHETVPESSTTSNRRESVAPVGPLVYRGFATSYRRTLIRTSLAKISNRFDDHL